MSHESGEYGSLEERRELAGRIAQYLGSLENEARLVDLELVAHLIGVAKLAADEEARHYHS
jgi:hypothetical protein